ncbi:MAG: hypothetical protein P4L46_04870 [Fimbriimonas sp.]|nr:hypothetical protein [Fimbriimonas sp.]
MEPHDDSDMPEYLQRLDSFLTGKSQTTLFLELEKCGWTPEDPDTLSDEDLSRSLTDLIWSLGDLQVFIEDTDHLSDRELYNELLDYCDEQTVCFVGIPDAATHWSPIGSYGPEDVQIWLRYYASPERRAEHVVECPNEPLPPSEIPPYPRPWLPQHEFLPEEYDEVDEDGDEDV